MITVINIPGGLNDLKIIPFKENLSIQNILDELNWKVTISKYSVNGINYESKGEIRVNARKIENPDYVVAKDGDTIVLLSGIVPFPHDHPVGHFHNKLNQFKNSDLDFLN